MNKAKLLFASIVVMAGAALESHLNACTIDLDHLDVPIGGCNVEPNNPGFTACYIGQMGDPCTGG